MGGELELAERGSRSARSASAAASSTPAGVEVADLVLLPDRGAHGHSSQASTATGPRCRHARHENPTSTAEVPTTGFRGIVAGAPRTSTSEWCWRAILKTGGERQLRGPRSRLYPRAYGERTGPVVAVVAAGVLATACTSSSSEPEAQPITSAPTQTDRDPTPTPTETAMPEPGEQARLDARLIAAAWENDVELAGRLIERGADVNAQDDTQQSAFLIAASEGYVDLLDLTMGNGADLDEQGLLQRHRADPRDRARARGDRGTAGAGGHRRGPREQPRLDRAARVGDPRRRHGAVRRHGARPGRGRGRRRHPRGQRRPDRWPARRANGADRRRGLAPEDRRGRGRTAPAPRRKGCSPPRPTATRTRRR